MRWILFKVIMFLSGFLYLEGILLPEAMKHNEIPLWINIILLTLLLTSWMVLIDYMVLKLTKDKLDDVL